MTLVSERPAKDWGTLTIGKCADLVIAQVATSLRRKAFGPSFFSSKSFRSERCSSAGPAGGEVPGGEGHGVI